MESRKQYMVKLNLFLGCNDGSIHTINVINHINRIKNKNYMIISIDADKAFDKIKYFFMTKTFKKLDLEGMYLNIIKALYTNPMVNSILSGETLKAFPIRSGIRLSPIIFNIVLKVLEPLGYINK